MEVCGRKGIQGIMNRQRRKKCGYIRWVLWISCAMLLSACGEDSEDHDMAADTLTAEEEQVSQEPEQEAADEPVRAENSEEPEESEESQDTAETEDIAVLNEKRFYEGAETLGFNREGAEEYYQKLCKDNVFKDNTAELTAMDIEDLDQNGQPDLVVMVQEAEHRYYGEGCIYFYMNEDEAYCFRDEAFPFFFSFFIVSGDFDGDGYTEIAFEAMGTGCNGAGDWYSRILKYKDHTMEPMSFPSEDDEYWNDMPGIYIEITQETEANTYSAYCEYLGETIVFEAESGRKLDERKACGGSSRGYFNLEKGEYEGKDALEVSEYIYGENGIAHGLGVVKFLIVWDENGEGQIVKWWIEPW